MRVESKPQKLISDRQGTTLLAFLRDHLNDYPSVKSIKRAIEAKQCTINGRVETFSTHPLNVGDLIEISIEIDRQDYPLVTLYEDEDLIVYNKPPGKTSESFQGILVHRLDKETSGVMIVAKTEEAAEAMIEKFAKREIEKKYFVICDGIPSQQKWKMDHYLGKVGSYQGGVIYGSVDQKKGKRAISHFTRLKTGENASLLLVEPITGRTHQIRAQLKKKKHPVLGDWQYSSKFTCLYRPPRHLLHAAQISFIHPKSQRRITIEAPYFKDFLEAEKALFGP